MKKKNNYAKKKTIKVNVSKKIRKLQTIYGRDNTKQAEMPSFCCGLSRQEKLWPNYIKKKKILTLT